MRGTDSNVCPKSKRSAGENATLMPVDSSVKRPETRVSSEGDMGSVI